MKLHLFHLTIHGIARAIGQFRAGARLCRSANKPLRPLIPASVNSMTAAWSFKQTLAANAMPPPRTILDIGANQSQMSRMLKMSCGNDVRLLSFEPNPKLTPDGEVFRIALSNSDGRVTFSIPANDADWGRVGHSEGGKEFEVESARLDTLAQNGRVAWDSLPHPILAKIDTEGHEFEVLQGMGKLLASVDMLLIEVDNSEVRGKNYSLISLCTMLAASGFTGSKVLYACYDGPDAPAYCDMLFWR